LGGGLPQGRAGEGDSFQESAATGAWLVRHLVRL